VRVILTDGIGILEIIEWIVIIVFIVAAVCIAFAVLMIAIFFASLTFGKQKDPKTSMKDIYEMGYGFYSYSGVETIFGKYKDCHKIYSFTPTYDEETCEFAEFSDKVVAPFIKDSPVLLYLKCNTTEEQAEVLERMRKRQESQTEYTTIKMFEENEELFVVCKGCDIPIPMAILGNAEVLCGYQICRIDSDNIRNYEEAKKVFDNADYDLSFKFLKYHDHLEIALTENVDIDYVIYTLIDVVCKQEEREFEICLNPLKKLKKNDEKIEQ